MNKENLLIAAVAAVAIFGVYKMTRPGATTVQAKPSAAIQNTSLGGIWPGFAGSLDLGLGDMWNFAPSQSLLNLSQPPGKPIKLDIDFGATYGAAF